MDTQRIKDAVDLLNTVLNDSIAEEPPFLLSIALTPSEVGTLRQICRTNVSIPEAVHNCYHQTTKHSVYRLLDKLLDAVGR